MPETKETYVLGYTKNGNFHPLFEGITERISDLRLMQMNLQTAGARWEVKKASEVYPLKVHPVFEDIFNRHFPKVG